MILTFIALGLITLGIIFLVIDMDYFNDGLFISGVLNLVAGLCAGMVISVIAIGNHCLVDKQIYDAKMERESILKQLEAVNNNYEDVSKVKVIQRVYEWNQDVHDTKHLANNKWTNWLCSQKYADSLDYIELEK